MGRVKQSFQIIAWIPVIVFFGNHVASSATVAGRSMQPTFNPDSSGLKRDVVLLNKTIGAGGNAWKVGDVVTLWSPSSPETLLTKRLLALPGSLVRTLPPYPDRYVRIPPGHCWVEGDERFHSRDSNTFGPVPLGLLTSRVDWILWPPSRFGPVGVRGEEKEKRVISPRII